MGSSKKTQAWPPLPERDRSTATGHPQALRRIPIGRDRLLPSRFVEIGHEHRCLALAIEDIKTYNIP